MKTISPLCENGERGWRASCTRPPTIGSGQREEEDQRAEGGVASLSLAFLGRGKWAPFGRDQQGEKLNGAKSVKMLRNLQQYEDWEIGKGPEAGWCIGEGSGPPRATLRCRRAADSDWRRIQPQSSNGQCSSEPGSRAEYGSRSPQFPSSIWLIEK